jgi:hypothetical protein
VSLHSWKFRLVICTRDILGGHDWDVGVRESYTPEYPNAYVAGGVAYVFVSWAGQFTWWRSTSHNEEKEAADITLTEHVTPWAE